MRAGPSALLLWASPATATSATATEASAHAPTTAHSRAPGHFFRASSPRCSRVLSTPTGTDRNHFWRLRLPTYPHALGCATPASPRPKALPLRPTEARDERGPLASPQPSAQSLRSSFYAWGLLTVIVGASSWARVARSRATCAWPGHLQSLSSPPPSSEKPSSTFLARKNITKPPPTGSRGESRLKVG